MSSSDTQSAPFPIDGPIDSAGQDQHGQCAKPRQEPVNVRGLTGAGFEDLVARERGNVMGYCLRRGLRPAEAEDTCQDAFLVVWQNRGRVEQNEERSFLFGVLRNVLKTHWRKASQRKNTEQAVEKRLRSSGLDSQRVGSGKKETSRLADLLRADLQKALAGLPPRRRQVIELVHVRGWTRNQAAKHLGITLGSLYGIESKALATLRRRVK